MKILAIGPRTDAPSWEWVGVEMAEELRRHFGVVFFDGFGEIPAADAILIIKQRPSAEFVARARASGARVYFAPIDVYRDPSEIAMDGAMLGGCEAVVVHSETLRPALAPFCRRIESVEHHARFALPGLADFKTDGFVLWVGAIQNVPHLLRWLQHHPVPVEIRLLTDLDDREARIAAHFEAHRQGIALRFRDGVINGFPAERWSEAAQSRLMRECKASIDIKGDDFNQMTKPPTKAQQFVASGIPFGCNPGHPAVAYFRAHGFKTAVADDLDRLLSQAYWAETRQIAPRLREWTSRDAVASAYRQILSPEGAIAAPLPAPSSVACGS